MSFKWLNDWMTVKEKYNISLKLNTCFLVLAYNSLCVFIIDNLKKLKGCEGCSFLHVKSHMVNIVYMCIFPMK